MYNLIKKNVDYKWFSNVDQLIALGLMGAVLSRYGVPVITMNTVDPPLQQVIRALGGLAQ